jgi:hypothetical protein
MKTEQFPVQSITAKRHTVQKDKPFYIYYSHSMCFYDTKTEKEDLKFLKSFKHAKIVNPNGLGLGRDMIQYLSQVKQCDTVCYRGNTIGVVFEVLTALAMHKPVYSLEAKDIMTHYEILDFINIFVNNDFVKHDLARFKDVFPEYYDNFVSLLSGDLP